MFAGVKGALTAYAYKQFGIIPSGAMCEALEKQGFKRVDLSNSFAGRASWITHPDGGPLESSTTNPACHSGSDGPLVMDKALYARRWEQFTAACVTAAKR